MIFKLQLSVITVSAALTGALLWTSTAQTKAPSSRSQPTYCFFHKGDISLSSQIFTYDGSNPPVTVVMKWIEFIKNKHDVFFVGPRDVGCETKNVRSLKESHLKQGWEEVDFPIDQLLRKN